MTGQEFHMDVLKRMLSIPAISREEFGRARYMEEVLTDLGHPVKRIGNNLVAGECSSKEDTFNLVLNSHLDTVPPVDGWKSNPFEPEEKNGKICALGSNDAGASVVAMLSVFHFLKSRSAGKLNLMLVFSAEEEVSGENGIRLVLPELGRVDGIIVGEPTGMQPAVAERGLLVLDGKVRGKAGHAARNEGVNAIGLALEDAALIGAVKFEKPSHWLPDPSAQITMINGGTRHNVVPDLCTYVMDVRSNDVYTNEDLLTLLRERCHAELSPRSTHLRSSALEKDHVLMKVIEACNMKPFGSSTLSDMAVIPFPAVKMGPGESARSHTAGEFIMMNEINEGIAGYKRFIAALEEEIMKNSL